MLAQLPSVPVARDGMGISKLLTPNRADQAGFKFLIYSIYIQKLQVTWIFGGNSLHIRFSSFRHIRNIFATYSVHIHNVIVVNVY